MGKQRWSTFYFLRLKAGLGNQAAAAEFCGVSLRTIRNWDKQGAPLTAMRLLWFRTGDLSALHPEWRGFQIREELLTGPNKTRIPLTELRNWQISHQARCAEQRELQQLKASWAFRLYRALRILQAP